MTAFQLSERLAGDSHPVCALELCDVRLMNDSRYVWLFLIPRRADLSEWHELSSQDAAQLSAEISQTSSALKALTGATKINVAAIGNMVRQMHVHVVARHEDDETWPGTVWNAGQAKPYADGMLEALCSELRQELAPGS